MTKSISMNILQGNDLPWCINRDGFFAEKIAKQLLLDDIPQESVDNIYDNAVDILSRCPNPVDVNPVGKTGIIIGKVQSGKTSNFIALSALAFDNGYGVNIVLGGNKNNLLDQNFKRIKGYYKEVDQEQLVVLSTRENKALLNPEDIQKFLNEGRKIIVVGLKHTKHINQIAEIFDSPSLRDIPTLIIDDEGDQATLNTKVETESMSPTYEAVINLKNKLNRHCFVSITATPQANILIKTCDLLSPDFGTLVYPGDQYCGLHEFHNEQQDTLIRLIPEDEPNLLEEDGVPESFFDALAAFFVGGAIRRYKGDIKNHSMLIHPSQKKFDHKSVLAKVKAVMKDWLEKATDIKNGVDDICFEPFKNRLVRSYDLFAADGLALPEYNELFPFVLDCIYKCATPHLCNSDEDASINAKFYIYNIFVGGNMVERGITIKGLAVTYIMRRAKGKANVDNTEQRARWFGYKRSYLDVCRVYTTETIKNDFASIYEHEEDLWDSIERAQEKGLSFKDIPRVFVLASKRLNLTRKNVAQAERFKFSEWSKQDYLLLDWELTKENQSAIDKFRTTFSDKIEPKDYKGVNRHSIIKGLNYNYLYNNLIKDLKFPLESHIDNEFFYKVGEVLKKCDITPEIDVLWVRDGSGEERSLRDDGQINQLFQGRSSNMKGESSYPGDGALVLPDRSSVMQLQIHMVKPKNRPEATFHCPALALYIPLEYAEKMDKIIGQL
jgi:hypothetical protein